MVIAGVSGAKRYSMKLTGHDIGRSYKWRPGDVPGEVSETFSETAQIAGKSIRAALNTISLLKLPDGIQAEHFISRRGGEKQFLPPASLDKGGPRIEYGAGYRWTVLFIPAADLAPGILHALAGQK